MNIKKVEHYLWREALNEVSSKDSVDSTVEKTYSRFRAYGWAAENKIKKVERLAKRKRDNHPDKGDGSNRYQKPPYKRERQIKKAGGIDKLYTCKQRTPLEEPADVSLIVEQPVLQIAPPIGTETVLCLAYNADAKSKSNGGGLVQRVEFGPNVPDSIKDGKRYKANDLMNFALDYSIAHFESHNEVGYFWMDECRIEYGANVPNFIKDTKQDNNTILNLMKIAERNPFAYLRFEDRVAHFNMDKRSSVVIGNKLTKLYLEEHDYCDFIESNDSQSKETLFSLALLDKHIDVLKLGNNIAYLRVDKETAGLIMDDEVQDPNVDLDFTSIMTDQNVIFSKEKDSGFFYASRRTAPKNNFEA